MIISHSKLGNKVGIVLFNILFVYFVFIVIVLASFRRELFVASNVSEQLT